MGRYKPPRRLKPPPTTTNGTLPVSKPVEVPGDIMLKPREVAVKLGVSENTVYRLGKKGILVVHRIGRWPRYRLSEVEAFIEGGCVIE